MLLVTGLVLRRKCGHWTSARGNLISGDGKSEAERRIRTALPVRAGRCSLSVLPPPDLLLNFPHPSRAARQRLTPGSDHCGFGEVLGGFWGGLGELWGALGEVVPADGSDGQPGALQSCPRHLPSLTSPRWDTWVPVPMGWGCCSCPFVCPPHRAPPILPPASLQARV